MLKELITISVNKIYGLAGWQVKKKSTRMNLCAELLPWASFWSQRPLRNCQITLTLDVELRLNLLSLSVSALEISQRPKRTAHSSRTSARTWKRIHCSTFFTKVSNMKTGLLSCSILAIWLTVAMTTSIPRSSTMTSLMRTASSMKSRSRKL